MSKTVAITPPAPPPDWLDQDDARRYRKGLAAVIEAARGRLMEVASESPDPDVRGAYTVLAQLQAVQASLQPKEDQDDDDDD